MQTGRLSCGIKNAGPVDKRQRAEMHVKSSQGAQNLPAGLAAAGP
ncbi:hypothetical protein AtDm6_0653 [Acetobacter tropicalis]|uniref:Uncharacterized protein n=1 Tax=Acetobacter tropicalis TaxID=104102 RepID=A0A095B9K2_9PROT|nr:hypothetical protein AtDm6_0653 [Acetobacter tropicalis]